MNLFNKLCFFYHLQIFIYLACVLITLYIYSELSIDELSIYKLSSSYSFQALCSHLLFPLAYSYIQSTNALWLASSYDADVGNHDLYHLAPHWSSCALVVSCEPPCIQDDNFNCFLIFHLSDIVGSIPTSILVL